MKDVSFSWNEKLLVNSEDDFHVLRAFFAEQVMLELQCTEY